MFIFRRWAIVAAVVLVAVGALAVAALRALSGLRDDAVAEVQREVDRAARHAATRHRVVQQDLAQAAQRIARSELVAWLGLVADYADTLVDDHGHAEPFVVDFAKRVAAFRPSATRSALEAEGRAFIEGCHDTSDCIAGAVRGPIARARDDEPPATRPDHVMVFDGEGHALGATVATPPVVQEALRARAIVRDFDRWPGSDTFHALAAAPIVEGPLVRGVVLVGSVIGGARLERDAERVGTSLTWIVSGTIGVAATTLGPDEVGALDGDAWVTGRDVIGGNVRTTPTIVAALPRAEGPWGEAEGQLVWVAVGIAVLALGALALLMPRAPKPSV